MLLAICYAFSFGLGVGMKVVALNEFEISFASSKERKPLDKTESSNLNSIGTKMIVVFAVIHHVTQIRCQHLIFWYLDL